MSKKSVIGIVRSQTQAEFIVSELHSAGIPNHDISALLPDRRGTADFAHENNTKSPEGAIAGVAGGGVIGGTLGLLAGIGALAIPGLGPFIAAGPLLAALSGAAAGATVGGIAGALIGLGIPEIEAKKYEGKLNNGNILLAVHVNDGNAEDQVKAILKNNGVEDVSVAGEASVPKASSASQYT